MTIDYELVGEARIFTLEAWIERIRVQVWSVVFDDELKKVNKNLKPVDQPGLEKAVPYSDTLRISYCQGRSFPLLQRFFMLILI